MEIPNFDSTHAPIEPLTREALIEKIESDQGNAITFELYLASTREEMELRIKRNPQDENWIKSGYGFLPDEPDPQQLHIHCQQKALNMYDEGNRLFDDQVFKRLNGIVVGLKANDEQIKKIEQERQAYFNRAKAWWRLGESFTG